MKLRDDKGAFLQAFQALDRSALNRLFDENRDNIDPELAHRLKILKFSSLFKSITKPWDDFFHKKKIEETELVSDPVFIIGHWRSGTTFLHNLLSCDKNFTFPTMIQAFNPHSFISFGKMHKFLMDLVVPKTRSMDQIVIGSQVPQEDEFAIALTSGISPYFEMVFPRDGKDYQRFLRMKDVSKTELAQWKKAFIYFLKKITYLDPKTILLKSPTHTARLSLLSEMFPNAKFIHIIRDPYVVYSSMLKLYEGYTSHQHLQVVSMEDAKKDILSKYKEMFDAFEEEKEGLSSSRLITFKYENLIKDPLKILEEVYKTLELPDFDEYYPEVAAYLKTLEGYQVNKISKFPPDELREINRYCQRVFEVYGYDKIGV